jgi:arsenate reductase
VAYYTYILRCKDGSLYTGITTHLARRFAEHAGLGGRGAKYTASHPPLRYEAAWRAPHRAAAQRLEHRLKALSKSQKERLILGTLSIGPDLMQCTPLHITQDGGIIMLFICYARCTTCHKARAFLDGRDAAYQSRDIKEQNPTEDELRSWHRLSGLPLKRFFNTSGQQYRALELSKKLPHMTEDEQFSLLASDGMLVRRPILVGEDFVLVGFKPSEWEERLPV